MSPNDLEKLRSPGQNSPPVAEPDIHISRSSSSASESSMAKMEVKPAWQDSTSATSIERDVVDNSAQLQKPIPNRSPSISSGRKWMDLLDI